MFGQTLETQDLAVVGLLVVLEGVLSIDNALVLGLLAKRLPRHQQGKALTYGLVGAFIFRFIAIATASFLLRWGWVKLLGGAYLVWISIRHFYFERPVEPRHQSVTGHGQHHDPTLAGVLARFWPAVAVIELTDIAFAVDSILAAIGVVGTPEPTTPGGPSPKLWVVLIGGFLGVILMRFAAVLFIRLLERFPRFEAAAYLLVIVIGLKLLVDWTAHHWHFNHVVNFHDAKSLSFCAFWALMMACFAVGFLPEKRKPPVSADRQTANDPLRV